MDQSDKITNVNYVHDALVERLPAGWSLNRALHEGQAFYRWTDWTTARQCVVQVDEEYAVKAGTVDKLCDDLTIAVLDSFYTHRNLSPISLERMKVGAA